MNWTAVVWGDTPTLPITLHVPAKKSKCMPWCTCGTSTRPLARYKIINGMKAHARNHQPTKPEFVMAWACWQKPCAHIFQCRFVFVLGLLAAGSGVDVATWAWLLCISKTRLQVDLYRSRLCNVYCIRHYFRVQLFSRFWPGAVIREWLILRFC